ASPRRAAPAAAQPEAGEASPLPTLNGIQHALSGPATYGHWRGVMDGGSAAEGDAAPVRALAASSRGDGGLAPAPGASAPKGPDAADHRAEVFSSRSQSALFWLLRSILRPILSVFYDMRAYGLENIPKTGGALLIGNHPSYLDPVLVGLFSGRPVRFLMYKPYYENRWFHWFLKRMPVIPVAPMEAGNGPKSILQSLSLAREALARGEIVVIYPEGATTRNGTMHEFKRGMEFLVRKLGVPVIPFHVDGTWGSVFSWRPWAPLKAVLMRGRRLLQLRFGPALERPEAQLGREAVELLGADNMESRVRARGRTLARDFARVAKWNWFKPAVADSTGRRLSYGQALTATVLLAGALAKTVPAAEKNVGVYLPASVGAVLSNTALAAEGKVAVNLNFTAGDVALGAAVEKAELRHVLTSRRFLEAFPPAAALPGTLFVEDLLAGVPRWKQALTYAALLVLPRFLAERVFLPRAARSLDETAAILFTSGSSDLPKGVELTHLNVQAEMEMMREIAPYDKGLRFLGILPFFHSFGYSTTLWFTLLRGIFAFHHPNPLDARGIEKAVRDNKLTGLLATPTWLRHYVKRVAAEAFATLDFVRAGAEDLPEELADAFAQKFGTRPLQGYGLTESTAGAVFNQPDRPDQKGTLTGGLGWPLPGLAPLVVDPETFKPLPFGKEGLLIYTAASVMKGYYRDPAKTAEALRRRWLLTGDIAVRNSDGSIRLVGRLSRFSKILGEMVPHPRVEKVLQAAAAAAGAPDAAIAVTGVPDAKRGERLVVLHTALGPVQAAELVRRAREAGLPNLWIPDAEGFHQVEALPLLGTGKLDLRRLKELALALDAERGP
ncbi:MAG TPA: AMP-binding protein, partial [Elusimicrobiota bacterium]|nr:AMP-binding protein [Elusimicrobiota bacterium]